MHVSVTRTFEIVHTKDYIAPRKWSVLNKKQWLTHCSTAVTALTKHFDSQRIVRFGLPRYQ